MNTLKLFHEKIPELEFLPEKPKVFWYVSAGKEDFRGPVFLTQHHIDHELKHHGKEFIKPDLFVFNCLGDDVQDLRNKLSYGEVELRNDGLTKIKGVNYKELSLKDGISFYINPDYIEINHAINYKTGKPAFYFELEISGRKYFEIQKILYFEAENIDFFNKIILNDFFYTLFLCAIREGCGYGGCKKSIIEYIYQGSQPLFFTNKGFKPKYNILFNDFTKEIFEQAVNDSQILTVDRSYSNYILESQDRLENDSTIFKINYDT